MSFFFISHTYIHIHTCCSSSFQIPVRIILMYDVRPSVRPVLQRAPDFTLVSLCTRESVSVVLRSGALSQVGVLVGAVVYWLAFK